MTKSVLCSIAMASLLACGGSPPVAPSAEEVTATCGAQLDQLSPQCRLCALGECRGELSSCCGATGCVPLVACSTRTGCTHASCYDPKTCKSEVDGAGGITGGGTARGGDVGACVQAAAAQDASCAACLQGQ